MQCATFNIHLIGSRFQLIIFIFDPKNQARENRAPRGNYNPRQAIHHKKDTTSRAQVWITWTCAGEYLLDKIAHHFPGWQYLWMVDWWNNWQRRLLIILPHYFTCSTGGGYNRVAANVKNNCQDNPSQKQIIKTKNHVNIKRVNMCEPSLNRSFFKTRVHALYVHVIFLFLSVFDITTNFNHPRPRQKSG